MKHLSILIFMFFTTEVMAVCSSPISRTNFSPNTVLTSTKLNSDFNDAYTRLNELPGDCITDETITSSKIDDGTIVNADISASADIARSKLGTINYQISSSSGAFSSAASALTDVTNLSVSITTTGKPVELSLVSEDGGSNACSVSIESIANYLNISFLRAGAVISNYQSGGGEASGAVDRKVPGSSVRYVDFGAAAGPHTYKVQIGWSGSVSSLVKVNYCRLLAREL